MVSRCRQCGSQVVTGPPGFCPDCADRKRNPFRCPKCGDKGYEVNYSTYLYKATKCSLGCKPGSPS